MKALKYTAREQALSSRYSMLVVVRVGFFALGLSRMWRWNEKSKRAQERVALTSIASIMEHPSACICACLGIRVKVLKDN